MTPQDESLVMDRLFHTVCAVNRIQDRVNVILLLLVIMVAIDVVKVALT